MKAPLSFLRKSILRLKIEREIGKCSCKDTKIIVKEKVAERLRFFYEGEQDTVLLLCRSCNAKIRKSFRKFKDD